MKLWNIRTRGNPRKQFANRVDQQIAIMDRKGYVIVYKSKNERVKLGWVKYTRTNKQSSGKTSITAIEFEK